MATLAQRHILLVVTGGIAAYKAPDLVRRLRDAGATVRVAMTPAATKFVRPLTFQAVSGVSVHVDLFDPGAEAAMGHIELARWADLVVVAPASADFIARLAHGLADDLPSTLCLATAAPILVAPAMNRLMWAHAATQANVAVLRARGVRFVGPDEGEQACGETGAGRMAEPPAIVVAALCAQGGDALAGLRVLLTAGPTQEPIDPVRFITNRSSGKMGYAVAAAARDAGARVTLITGPTRLVAPAGCEVVAVTTAQDMLDAVLARVADCDIFIASAAVADYTIATPAPHKVKKAGTALTLTLTPTPDILRTVATRAGAPFTVGFAAETERLAEHARGKLTSKSLNMIAANLVGRVGTGFESDDNELSVFWKGGERQLGKAAKQALARDLVAIIAERYRAEAVHSE
ncbi:MAG: bifunctional phosphopantothenoylcysteine decarboxylase/phosphopantothenate--cysteine ligase CoaBC [Gammaproteobacteria bacterium]|nr:bifunctional phosphopantothenoylcysteine decarboxylase/phosphopantothenate--cysteine ligase CoaBC [Gammaproteobacteria bacterium]